MRENKERPSDSWSATARRTASCSIATHDACDWLAELALQRRWPRHEHELARSGGEAVGSPSARFLLGAEHLNRLEML